MSSQPSRATASGMTRSPSVYVAGQRLMNRVFPSAARWSSVTRAASATSLYAPGATPWRARMVAISDHNVVLRVLSEAWPSSGLPHMGPGRSTQRRDSTNGFRSGRVSLL